MTPTPEPHATVGKSGSVIQAAAALPIGSVPERGVAHFKLDLEGGFFLNGNRKPAEGLSTELSGLDRGTYFLRASVLDQDGKPVISSQQITFHVRQPSIKSPQSPQAPPKPPPKPAPKPATPPRM